MAKSRNLPTHLSSDEQAELDEAMRTLEKYLLDQIAAVLAEIPAQPLRELVYGIAFKPNNLLPKRASRPQLLIAHLTDWIYRAYEPDGPHRDCLLQFAITVQEYYDILDDVVDGDVREGHTVEVTLVTQLLLPIMVKRLAEMGSQASRYWADRALWLVQSLYLEKRKEKSLDTYLASLDAQGWFFAFVTGLAALVAGQDEQSVRRAEEIGKLAYRYGQFFLDLAQAEQDSEDNWNACHFLSKREVLRQNAQWYEALRELAQQLPDPRAAMMIHGVLSVDLTNF